jgi:hypothetical protein
VQYVIGKKHLASADNNGYRKSARKEKELRRSCLSASEGKDRKNENGAELIRIV